MKVAITLENDGERLDRYEFETGNGELMSGFAAATTRFRRNHPDIGLMDEGVRMKIAKADEWMLINDQAKNSFVAITVRLRSGRIVDAMWEDPDQVISETSDLEVGLGRWLPVDPEEAVCGCTGRSKMAGVPFLASSALGGS
jgi:hypothetical protein